MLRSIQRVTIAVAAFFALVAYLDLVVWHISLPHLSAASNVPWDMMPNMTGLSVVALATVLALMPLLATLTVVRSCAAARDGDYARLEYWRRLTWSTSIVETAGCIVFVGYGSLLFLPTAFALLIVGIAELATILRDIERGVYPAHHAPNVRARHNDSPTLPL